MFIKEKYKVGDRVLSNSGADMELLEIIQEGGKCSNIMYRVLFTESGKEVLTHASQFQSGYVTNPSPVEFGEEFKYRRNKMINNIMSKGVESVKEGTFLEVTEDDRKQEWFEQTARSKWTNMRSRCKDIPSNRKENGNRYLSHSVDSRWRTKRDFQNFFEWYCANYKFHGTSLDKDILSGKSKKYSPETCCFITDKLNSLLGFFNSIVGDKDLAFIYRVNGERSSHQNQSYAEKIRMHVICRITWVRLWLRVNPHLIDDNVKSVLERKLIDIETDVYNGVYDNYQRSIEYTIF